GLIAKESVVLIFEKLMKMEASTVEAAVKSSGAASMGDEELSAALDKIIEENVILVKQKGAGALSTIMGRAMALLRGKADGQKINSMLKEKLERRSK
ncbi:MAG: GatB/YqeY domain-containing protein, partial [Nitrososphaera sp.]|nr:GatB/YqeY domain-containing protein [Nitrososphaera sp.]